MINIRNQTSKQHGFVYLFDNRAAARREKKEQIGRNFKDVDPRSGT